MLIKEFITHSSHKLQVCAMCMETKRSDIHYSPSHFSTKINDPQVMFVDQTRKTTLSMVSFMLCFATTFFAQNPTHMLSQRVLMLMCGRTGRLKNGVHVSGFCGPHGGIDYAASHL